MIYVDVSVLNMASFITGIQRVAREILTRLCDSVGSDLALITYNAKDDSYYRIDNGEFKKYYVDGYGFKESMITKERVDVSSIGTEDVFFDLDAAWMGKISRSYLLPILKKQGTKIVAHIYDTIPISYPEFCEQHVIYRFMDYLTAHLIYADKIIVNANGTKAELEKIATQLGISIPECAVVPLGANFNRTANTEKNGSIVSEKVKTVTKNPFLLMVGTIEPRKNPGLLLKAYDRGLKGLGYNIIYAGSWGWNYEDFKTNLEIHPDYGKNVFLLQGISDEEINYLYSTAKFLVFASYMEGYGLPLIEAIRNGTPVLASDMSVSREVAGEYADFFTQDNPEELVEIVKHYHLDDNAYQAKKSGLKGAIFPDWDESAKKMYAELKRSECEK